VPSFDHELIVELFRTRATLATELLRAVAAIDLGPGQAELGSIDLSEVTPPEYRADAVVLLRDGTVVRAAVIVAVQLQVDADKRRRWPAYVAVLHARLGCPVYLLVLAASSGVAAWASAPIALGHPLAAIETVPEEAARLYWDAIHARLPPALRRELETIMIKSYTYQSEFAQKYFGQGIAQGREEGRARLVQAVAVLAAAKLGSRFTADDRACLDRLDDDALGGVIVELGQATTVAEARAALPQT